MARGYQLEEAGHIFDRNRFRPVAAGRHHHVRRALGNQIDAGGAEARGQQSVVVRGRAAALHIAEDRHARLEARQLFKMFRQPQGVALVFVFQLGHPQAGAGLVDVNLTVEGQAANLTRLFFK